MEIRMIPVSEINEYENNPRNNDGAVTAVAESISEFGFKVPIVVDEDWTVVAGHTRLKAARRLGLSEVPCVVASDLTAEQVKAYRLADNKTGELAEWDFNALEAELFELRDMDMSLFGFEVDRLTEDGFGEDFELPDGDKPAMRTITLSLCEAQYGIVMACHDWVNDNVAELHSFDGKNDKSNAIFEVIYQWAEQKGLA